MNFDLLMQWGLLLTGLIGLGGAALNVPYMSFHNVPVHKAVGSASSMGLFIAVPGMAADIRVG